MFAVLFGWLFGRAVSNSGLPDEAKRRRYDARRARRDEKRAAQRAGDDRSAVVARRRRSLRGGRGRLRSGPLMSLFEKGDFALHSGSRTSFRIDASCLLDSDLDSLALLVARQLRWREVVAVPRGGVQFARALDRYSLPALELPRLLVDDVLTTGRSLEEVRRGDDLGVVIFARSTPPPWVYALFTMNAAETVSGDAGYETKRSGALMWCGCWWDAPGGSQVGVTVSMCPLHGQTSVCEANVPEPEPLAPPWVPTPTDPEPF